MLSDYLKQLRQRSGLTSSQWAEKSEIARTTLWRWEQGRTLPRDHELCQALDSLSASPVEQKQAWDILRSERLVKGTGPLLPPVAHQTGLTRLKRGDLLRALRLRSGRTQREAAQWLQINRVTVAEWERGHHWPEGEALHRACHFYGASQAERIALTTLSASGSEAMPSHPDEVVWDDIETYQDDFNALELRYLTFRSQLAGMPHPAARHLELACFLDYLHSILLQSRSAEVRRELRRIAFHPVVLAAPALFARHRVLFAVAQKQDAKGDRAAEQVLGDLLHLGDAVPIGERYRAKAEWAERMAERGDTETSRRLSAAASKEAHASGDAHLLALNQRQHTANLIAVGDWEDAARALEHFPTHTPLLAVQRLLTYATLLRHSGSFAEAPSAYTAAACAAQAAGMTSYANHFRRLAAAVPVD